MVGSEKRWVCWKRERDRWMCCCIAFWLDFTMDDVTFAVRWKPKFLTVQRNTHWSENRWSHWEMNPRRSVTEVQSPNSKIAQVIKPTQILHSLLTHDNREKREKKNHCLKANLLTWLNSCFENVSNILNSSEKMSATVLDVILLWRKR